MSEFLGLEVSNGINRGGRKWVDQKSLEELAPFLQAVLDLPSVVAFGWSQYTPYFNDGEPCVFSVNELRVKLDTDDEDTSLYDCDFCVSCRPDLGRVEFQRGPDGRVLYGAAGEYLWQPYQGPDEHRYKVLKAANEAIQDPAFERVLLDKFGDHAMVKVTRAGIEVEFYSHD